MVATATHVITYQQAIKAGGLWWAALGLLQGCCRACCRCCALACCAAACRLPLLLPHPSLARARGCLFDWPPCPTCCPACPRRRGGVFEEQPGPAAARCAHAARLDPEAGRRGRRRRRRRWPRPARPRRGSARQAWKAQVRLGGQAAGMVVVLWAGKACNPCRCTRQGVAASADGHAAACLPGRRGERRGDRGGRFDRDRDEERGGFMGLMGRLGRGAGD